MRHSKLFLRFLLLALLVADAFTAWIAAAAGAAAPATVARRAVTATTPAAATAFLASAWSSPSKKCLYYSSVSDWMRASARSLPCRRYPSAEQCTWSRFANSAFATHFAAEPLPPATV